MFDIGFAELVLLAVIAMVVVGPEKLPGVIRTVGKTVGQARRFMTGLQNQIEQEIKLDELNKKIMAETKGMDFTAKNTQPSHQTEDAEIPSIQPKAEDLPQPPTPTETAASTPVEKSDDTQRS